jgi:hypothetical protein
MIANRKRRFVALGLWLATVPWIGLPAAGQQGRADQSELQQLKGDLKRNEARIKRSRQPKRQKMPSGAEPGHFSPTPPNRRRTPPRNQKL